MSLNLLRCAYCATRWKDRESSICIEAAIRTCLSQISSDRLLWLLANEVATSAPRIPGPDLALN
jgi:hypothetical protein